MTAADVCLALAGLPVLAAGGYLGTLAALARPARPPAGRDDLRFDVIVPAHDEEQGIAATVASLRALDYPLAQFRILVVADNCTDATAARARAAGALVLERRDAERRGKGYALDVGYAASLAAGFADAVVVVDADTVVAPGLLSAFAARLAAGAECVQAEYGVRNPDASWRTRLTAVAFALYHTVRSRARERLGLSCGLRGNGMGFTTALLRRVPHAAHSVVEDVEYGVALGLAGVRVAYVEEAWVRGDMPASGAAAATQRARWERGRGLLMRRCVPALLRAAVARRSAIAADLAMDLLVPPLARLVATAAAGTAVAAALWAAGSAGPLGLAPWALAVVALVAYVARGWQVAGGDMRAAGALVLGAPAYAAWKLALLIRRRGGGQATEWVRTAREPGR